EKMKNNEALIIMMAKRTMASYIPDMQNVPSYLDENFSNKNYLLVYPYSEISDEGEFGLATRSINNPDDFSEIGKFIGNIFK
ncbi:MAG: cation:proton antiporter, partial [Cruoricaptor ignavus]|nr:cation:proton antiporter [Cruoricaptor ignavus]